MNTIPIVPVQETSPTMVEAVIAEVAARLERLVADPTYQDAIDIHGLPLDDRQRDVLRERLGQGEVDARLDVAGSSRITETAFAGVWWVSHLDASERPVLEQIVIARVPDLLPAHPADIALAAARLAGRTGAPVPTAPPTECAND
ncbi:MAG: hydrogenase expression/formation C-terminal domain-containing protein [Burkholderiaceae bacterium]